MFRIFVVFLLLWSSPALSQQSSDYGEVLRSIHLDPAFRQGLRERGYTGEKFEVMIDHTRQLYADKAIVAGLLRQIEFSLKASGNRTGKVFFLTLDRALSQAYSIGLTRLPNSDRRQLFSVDYSYIKSLPDRECTKLLSGKQRPERAAEFFDRFMVQLTARQIADYHRILRKATRLGLARNATPRVLNAAETRRVEEAIFPRVDNMIGLQKNSKALYKAWAKGPTATQKYMCTFNKMFAFSALQVGGSTGDLAILYIMAD